MITDSSFIQYRYCLFNVSPYITLFLRYQSRLVVSPYRSTFPSLVNYCCHISRSWVVSFVYTVLIFSTFLCHQFVCSATVLVLSSPEAAEQGGCSASQTKIWGGGLSSPTFWCRKYRQRSIKLVWQNIQSHELFTDGFIGITLGEIIC